MPLEPIFDSLVANYRLDMLQNIAAPLILSYQSLLNILLLTDSEAE